MNKYKVSGRSVYEFSNGKWVGLATLQTEKSAHNYLKLLQLKPRTPEVVVPEVEKAAVTVPKIMSGADEELYSKTYERVLAATGDDTKAFLAAWGAMKRGMMGLKVNKAADNGPTIVRGWAIMFGDSTVRDTHKTYFDKSTDYMLDYYTDAPLWYEHMRDKHYGLDPIGRRTAVQKHDEFGVWMEHELFEDHPLYAKTASMVEKGELSYSTDSFPNAVYRTFRTDEKYYPMWPMPGCSLVKSPAEPGLGPVVTGKSQEVGRSAPNISAFDSDEENALQSTQDNTA